MAWIPSSIVTSAPTVDPVSVQEAADYLRIDDTDSNSVLVRLIKTATRAVENLVGAAIITQQRKFFCSSFDDFAAVPLWPVSAIVSIKYLDSSGVEQTLSSSVYELVSLGSETAIRLQPQQSWPSVYWAPDAIRVVLTAGAASAAAADETLRMAVLIVLGHWYDNREQVGTISDAACELIGFNRQVVI